MNLGLYLEDIAEINFKKVKRKVMLVNLQNLVSLAVKKRSGKNLINAANKIDVIVDEDKMNFLPI